LRSNFTFTQVHKVDAIMKSKLFLSILIAVLLAGSAQAQYTGDNQTNTISGVSSNWVSTAYFVGQNWDNDALVIQAGGVLSNGFAYVGYQSGADFNTALITGSGSTWSNANDLSIGYLGVLNSLTISNGGALYNATGFIGNAAFSDDNAALITGSGSVWSNAQDLSVGYFGAENSLTIANGGIVYDFTGHIGNQTGANDNTVLVSDPGSVWNNADNLFVGSFAVGNSLTVTNNGAVLCSSTVSIGEGGTFNTALVTGSGSIWSGGDSGLSVGTGGSGNSLTIASGGKVYSGNGAIGQGSGTVNPGINNTVLVTGSGSLWSISFGGLSVGEGGSGNSLTISNSGHVVCTDGGVIGGESSTNNTVVVASGGTLVVSNAGFGILVVSPSGGPDSLVLNGGNVTVDGLVLTNGLNSVIAFNGGTLASGETLVTTPQAFVVGDGTDAAVFHLSGGVHSFGSVLEIQNNASLTGCGTINGNVLIDAGGAVLADCGGTLTFTGSVTNNGSIIATNGTFINFYGPVVNSGQIGPTNSVHYYPIVPSTGNTNSWINPAGDKWEQGFNWSAGAPSIIQPAVYITNASSKTVAIDSGTAFGFTNTLTVSNLTVSGPSGSTNTLLVNTMDVSTPLQIVSNLTVNAGGIVAVTNSALEVDGSGAVPGTSGLFIGVSSAGEQLSIHGGRVSGDVAYLGYNSSSSNNSVLVGGSGSVWSNANNLYVGYGGAFNSLIITNGSTVYNARCIIGLPSGANNNTVLVTGSGSVWNNANGNELDVGYLGTGNSLTIASSGTVYNGGGVIGFQSGTSNNTVLVTGNGSVWSNANILDVGYGGALNSLTISNGGVVYDGFGFIGYQSGANNNAALVTDSGSVWTNTLQLVVGNSGSGNQLVVTNSGAVSAPSLLVGLNAGAQGTLTLNGGTISLGNFLSVGRNASSTGTVWITAGTIVCTNNDARVGRDGVGQMTVSNGTVSLNALLVGYSSGARGTFTMAGGQMSVVPSNIVVGYFAGAIGAVTVTGGNLTLSGNGNLIIGQAGMGTYLQSGGTVAVNQLILTNGANSVIAFNAGLLTSSGTSVTNSQLFVVGDGADAATFQLNGGVHSFANNLELSNNATLSGCGTINGNVVVDPGGTVFANCGGKLTFTGILTNNGTMQAVNGTVLQAYGLVVNNGVIIATNGSVQFLGGLVNNGCVLTETDVQISSITRSGNNITIQVPSGTCATYQLQVTPSLKPATWTPLGPSQGGTGGALTFTDTGGATNRPGRFYRIDITLP
jgi:T5SS/PEP-CTERM-associated repeat protein